LRGISFTLQTRVSYFAQTTGLGHGVYKNSIDSVFSGDWLIGRIYERKGFPNDVRFFWSLHGIVLTRPPDINTDGHTPCLEAAKAEFKSNWLRWLEWSERAEVE
jgi:hypothetical protein